MSRRRGWISTSEMRDEERFDKQVPWPIGFQPDETIARPPWHVEARQRDPDGLMVHHSPATELEALMQTAPGDTPQVSLVERHDLRERLADAMDTLSERDRWILEARLNRGLSFRQVAAELGLSKSVVHRRWRQVLKRLRTHLLDDPTIQEYLDR